MNFVCYLYIMGLINAWIREHIQIQSKLCETCNIVSQGQTFSLLSLLNTYSEPQTSTRVTPETFRSTPAALL